MSRHKGAWRAGFIACLKKQGEIVRCAQFSGVTHRAVSKAQASDPAFAADVADALESYAQSRSESALRNQRRYLSGASAFD